MLRTFPRLSLLTIALLAGAGTAAAQTGNATGAPAAGTTAAGTSAQQAGQPPATERIEPGSDVPATRIEPRRGTRINEKRNNGQVTEIEVQSGKSRYIMRPNQAAGNAQAGDAQSSAFRAPQWQVMEFDLNGTKKGNADADAAAAAAGTTAPGATTGTTAAAGPARPAGARTPANAAPGKVPPATVPMTKPADIPPPPPMPTQQ